MIRCLHISDLHCGVKWASHWPNAREVLENDIKKLVDRDGAADLVIFTGDITQCGKEDEFGQATMVLERLLRVAGRKPSEPPPLVVVPGNHDLIRPDVKSPTALALRTQYADDQFQEWLWNDTDSEYRSTIAASFAAFERWSSGSALPIINRPQTAALIPGDTAQIVEINGLRFGVLTLNSAFLQLTGGDYKGKLALDHRQALAVCGDLGDWAARADIRLLATHHPPSWLSPEALEIYQRDIYTPDRFDIHLFGHMHSASTETTARGGSGMRVFAQATSLFGLERVGDPPSTVRRIGYSWLEIGNISDERRIRCWPRTAEAMDAGHAKIVPDFRLDLQPDESFVVAKRALQAPASVVDVVRRESEPASPVLLPGSRLDILSSSSTVAGAAKSVLERVPRWEPRIQQHHAVVREAERLAVQRVLSSSRVCWIVSEWGLSHDEFAASALQSPSTGTSPLFRVDCSGCVLSEDFGAACTRSLGLALQEFLAAVDAIDRATLVLQNVAADGDVENVARSAVEFAASLRVVILASSRPPAPEHELVQLGALDIADTKRFIEAHPMGGDSMVSPADIAKFRRLTDGYPARIERVLRQLQTSSIDELGEWSYTAPVAADGVSTAVEQAVERLSSRTDPVAARAYRLLKILTILRHGETLQRIRRFNTTEVFGQEHAHLLHAMGLIDSSPVSTHTQMFSGSQSPALAAKRLFVSRPVREHIEATRMARKDIDAMVMRAADFYFGERWRDGQPSLPDVPKPATSDEIPHVVMNAQHVIITRLARDRVAGGKPNPTFVTIASLLLTKFEDAGRFSEAFDFGRELINIIGEDVDADVLVRLEHVVGYAARMQAQHDQALAHQSRAEQRLSQKTGKGLRATIEMEMARTLSALKRVPEARGFAQRALEHAAKDGSMQLSAKAFLVRTDPESSVKDVIAKLTSLETEARDSKLSGVADNIAVDLASLSSTASERKKWHERVLGGQALGYTYVRALLGRATDLLEENQLESIAAADREHLYAAYSYLYTQRFGSLFDECHRIVWQLLIIESKRPLLLRLFRHSSLVWRLHGRSDEERSYIEEVEKMHLDQGANVGDRDLGYLLARRASAKRGSDE